MRTKTAKAVSTDSRLDSLEMESEEEHEALLLQTVTTTELESLETGPDPESAALMTPTLRAQGIRPVSENQAKGVTCPECGKPLVIAPRSGKDYIVCFEALKGEDACWYHRELPAQAKAKGK